MSSYVQRGLDPAVKKFLTYIGAIVVAVGSFIFHLCFPGASLLGMWVMLGIAAAVGWVIGRVLSHHVDGDGRGALIAAWALTVAWVIPVLGVTLSSVVLELADVAGRRRYLFACLSMLCAFASILKGAVAVAKATSTHSAQLASS